MEVEKVRTIKRIVCAAAAFAVMLNITAFPVSADDRQTVTVSYEARTAVFSGWGTALYRWGEAIGGDYDMTEEATRLLYGDSGLRMNIARYVAGGGDAPSHSHFADKDTAVPGWWSASALAEGKGCVIDKNADQHQRNVLESAVTAAGGNVKTDICAYSPPYFMTVSGCTAGAVYSGDDNITPTQADQYAGYLADIASAIKNSGVSVGSISPMNEPSSLHWKAYSTRQEGCHISQGEMQSRVLVSLRSALNMRGLTSVTIAASDEADPDTAAASYNALTNVARGCTGRITVHSTASADPDAFIQAAEDAGDAWITDADGLYTAGEDAGEMSAALGLSRSIINDLNRTSASAWVMWQAVNLNKPDLSGSYTGLVNADMESGSVSATQRYYAFGQFSRYIRPSSVLIKVDDRTIAAYDNGKHELTVVAVNDTAEEKHVKYAIEGFDILKGGSVTETRTSGSLASGEHWSSKPNAAKLYKSGFSADLEPNSVTTYVVSGVHLRVEGQAGDINSDGVINVTDVSLVSAYVKSFKSLDAVQQQLADVNGDGLINVSDISMIAAHVKGVRVIKGSARYSEDDLLTDEETTADEETTPDNDG